MPLDIRQWCEWLAVSVILAVVMAAVGIHAWDDSKPADNGAEAVPDVEWYAQEDEYFDRRIDENRAKKRFLYCQRADTIQPNSHICGIR